MSYFHVNEDSKALVNEDNGLLRQASVADTVKSSNYPQTHILHFTLCLCCHNELSPGK